MSWSLHIKELQGSTVDITLTSPQTATVHDLKVAYSRVENSVPTYQQRLVHERTELVDDHQLSSYPQIENGATIFLIRLIPFQIFVKGMDGSSHTISIPTKTPERYLVSQLKKIVEQRTGVRPEEQRLQYAGKQLVDSCTLGDYNLSNNATLHLVSRLRGGTTCNTCGHYTSTGRLYEHCVAAVRRGCSTVGCPSCSTELSMRALKSSQMSKTQVDQIEAGLTKNFCLAMPGVSSCRICGKVWSSPSPSQTCPSCTPRDETAAVLKVLASCETKPIGHAHYCPSIRACPSCGKLIFHTEGCKRVDCNGCQTTFCFVCLTIRSPYCQNYYPCSDSCPTAPRQTHVPRR